MAVFLIISHRPEPTISLSLEIGRRQDVDVRRSARRLRARTMTHRSCSQIEPDSSASMPSGTGSAERAMFQLDRSLPLPFGPATPGDAQAKRGLGGGGIQRKRGQNQPRPAAFRSSAAGGPRAARAARQMLRNMAGSNGPRHGVGRPCPIIVAPRKENLVLWTATIGRSGAASCGARYRRNA